MILYSIIPMEIVMGIYENSNVSKDEYTEMKYLGEMIQAVPIENNRYIIRRLISTSPKAYLNPRFQPGTIIDGGLVES